MAISTFIVTIDGPAGGGKSTAARLLAQRMDLRYVDTGALYRTATLAATEAGVDLDDGQALATLIEKARIHVNWHAGRMRVQLDGRDVSEAIRNENLTARVKRVAVHPEVRAQVNRLVRGLARGRSVVTEGRDQGTAVFPDADVKFFLEADLDVRARRRQAELAGPADLDQVREAIAERDASDRNRAVGALICAPDAIRVDTSGLSIPEMVGRLTGIVAEKLRVDRARGNDG